MLEEGRGIRQASGREGGGVSGSSGSSGLCMLLSRLLDLICLD